MPALDRSAPFVIAAAALALLAGSVAIGGCGSGNPGGTGAGGSASAGATGTAGASGVAGGAGAIGSGGTSAGSGGTTAGGSGGTTSNGGGGAAGALGGGGAGSGGNGGESATGGRGGGAGTGATGGRGGGAGTGATGGRGGASGAAGTTGSGGTGGGSTCPATPLAAGNSNKTIQVGGVSRSYILHVPTGYTGTRPVPLVIDFHGLGGSGSQQQSSSGYQRVADQEGFLILFPNGIDNAWNIGPCCTNSRTVDDLGFAKAMVTTTAAQGCVDMKRVYATGFSMGGGMSHYLACNAADVFAAVAPAAFDLLVPEEEPCAPSRPISVLTFRGTADTVVPFAGGKGSSGRVTFMGAQASFQRWVDLDGCTAPTTAEGECTYYRTCSAGVNVGLCIKQGGSHAPGDANVGWAFLSKFSLP